MAKKATAGEKIAKKSVAEIESVINGLDDYCQRITTGNLPHAVGSLRGALAAIVTLYSNGDAAMSKQIDAAIRRAERRAAKEAWQAGNDAAYEDAEGLDVLEDRIERKYGVKL